MPKERDTRKPKGFTFCQYKRKEDAEDAIKGMNGRVSTVVSFVVNLCVVCIIIVLYYVLGVEMMYVVSLAWEIFNHVWERSCVFCWTIQMEFVICPMSCTSLYGVVSRTWCTGVGIATECRSRMSIGHMVG